MKIEDDAVHAADDAPPDAKEGSEIATAPAPQTGTAEHGSEAPGDKLTAQLTGDDFGAMLDALHQKHFAGSKLTTDTESWNLVTAFVADIKRLWDELEDAVEKL